MSSQKQHVGAKNKTPPRKPGRNQEIHPTLVRFTEYVAVLDNGLFKDLQRLANMIRSMECLC